MPFITVAATATAAPAAPAAPAPPAPLGRNPLRGHRRFAARGHSSPADEIGVRRFVFFFFFRLSVLRVHGLGLRGDGYGLAFQVSRHLVFAC